MQNSKSQKINTSTPSIQDNRKLVDVFAWLIKEDKKQNPDNYNKLKQKQYD
ncbi:MAG: hypothetical protein PHG24_01365 [Candidatus Pacebacteria bacterium]|nr:hypothetical protein [Candidatus Paceibacterota bacterium]